MGLQCHAFSSHIHSSFKINLKTVTLNYNTIDNIEAKLEYQTQTFNEA
jgi:hypothetical protein